MITFNDNRHPSAKSMGRLELGISQPESSVLTTTLWDTLKITLVSIDCLLVKTAKPSSYVIFFSLNNVIIFALLLDNIILVNSKAFLLIGSSVIDNPSR